MLNELLSKVGGVLQRRTQERSQTYAGFVTDAADGKKINAEELADMLEAVGKSAVQFGEDVQLLTERRQWKATLDRKPHWDAENNRVAKLLETTRATHLEEQKALRARQSEELQDLLDQQRDIYTQRDLCDKARIRLMETSGRNREIAALSQERAEPVREIENGYLSRDFRDAQTRVAMIKSQLATLRRKQAADPIGDGWENAYKGPIAEAEKDLREAEAILARHQADVDQRRAAAAATQKQIDRVEAEALAVS